MLAVPAFSRWKFHLLYSTVYGTILSMEKIDQEFGSTHYDLSIFSSDFKSQAKWTPIIKGDFAEVPLTKGYACLVSVSDLPLVVNIKWQAASRGAERVYARSTRWIDGSVKALAMHRLILQAKKGDLVDHISGDTLDNRRENIRICTPGQNCYNASAQSGTSSRYKGVSFHKLHQKWYACITKDGKKMPIGLFDTEPDAAKAYDFAAKLIFGEFAKTNLMFFKRIV